MQETAVAEAQRCWGNGFQGYFRMIPMGGLLMSPSMYRRLWLDRGKSREKQRCTAQPPHSPKAAESQRNSGKYSRAEKYLKGKIEEVEK